MIPKRLIYVWMGTPEPLDVKENIKGWMKLNPDYELVRIDENEFDVNQYEFTKEAYRQGYFAFVSDVARIWAVNKYGGIYLDTDVKLLKPLDPIRRYRHCWAKEDVGMVASGLFFASEKNSEILEKILDEYTTKKFESNKKEQITTVHIISKILRDHYGLKDNKKTDHLVNDGIALSTEYFAPLHYWGGGKITSTSMGVHLYKNSWTSLNKNYLNYLVHQLMFYIPWLSVLVQKIKGRR
ncbi:glycosyltransferase family 32 protein [Limosilactobacillus ingluviei]